MMPKDLRSQEGLVTSRVVLNAAHSENRGNGSIVIAVAWVLLIGFQLLRTIKIDAYELSQTRLDLLGYWLAVLLSMLLGAWLVTRGRLVLKVLFLVLLFIFYITFAIALTAQFQPILPFLVSRYGIFIWFVLGIGFSAVIEILTITRLRGNFILFKKGLSIVLLVFGAQALFLAFDMLQDSSSSLSYQSVATSSTIFLSVVASVIFSLWGRKIPASVTFLFIGIGSTLVAAVALNQSVSIIAFWFSTVVLFLSQALRERRFYVQLSLIVVVLLAAGLFVQTEIYEDLVTKTRFAVFFASSGEFSPWSSRISLLPTFWNQFDVSPFFGHFEAELIAGAGEGYYVHSLPLSLLTHTGLMGTSIFCVVLFLIYQIRPFFRSKLDVAELYLNRMMLILLGIATFTTFFSWPPIWFMLGALCKRPMRQIECQ